MTQLCCALSTGHRLSCTTTPLQATHALNSCLLVTKASCDLSALNVANFFPCLSLLVLLPFLGSAGAPTCIVKTISSESRFLPSIRMVLEAGGLQAEMVGEHSDVGKDNGQRF